MATSWPEAHEDESSTEEGACIETRADHRWAALVALCLSVVIVNVDNTILNVALPTLVTVFTICASAESK